MDLPLDASLWTESRPWNSSEECRKTREDITRRVQRLSLETATIKHRPYDPNSWLMRAKTFAALCYPELAAGDAHKANLLCRNILESLERHPCRRLGLHMGFLMEDDGVTNQELARQEREQQREKIATLKSQVHRVLSRNLCFSPRKDDGLCVLQRYPWMKAEHLSRSDKLVAQLSREIAVSIPKPACVVRRYAFGKGVGSQDGADLLGVFASRDISEGELIVVDKTRAWGCNGPGKGGSRDNLYGGLGCTNPIHPNCRSESVGQDLRWIRDRSGKQAADSILKCRFLLCAIQDGAKHPLDHLAARVTPNYRQDEFRRFSLEADIAVLDDALQQFGIDIFADLNWDTWTFFVLMARLDNNSWSDPNASAVNSLFSLFNHSCEPNVRWQVPEDHKTMKMFAKCDVKRGEQLLICYDEYASEKPVAERRERFWRWINGPCQCSRCVREEAEQEHQHSSSSPSFSSSPGDWDTDEKFVLPEDLIKEKQSLFWN